MKRNSISYAKIVSSQPLLSDDVAELYYRWETYSCDGKHLVEEAVLGLVLPADEAPGVLAVVVPVQEHGQPGVDKRQPIRETDERPSFSADYSRRDCLHKVK